MYTIVFGVRSEIIKYIFENPIAVGIGNISFEIFLIHQLVIKYMDFINSHFLDLPTGICFIVDVILIILAVKVWKKIEKIFISSIKFKNCISLNKGK